MNYEFRIYNNKKQHRKIGTKRWFNICIKEDCTTSASRGYDYCVAHGGCKRCIKEDCTTSARRGYDYCVAHGGGKRCIKEDCTKSAIGAADYCIAHGGGKRCIEEGCTKSAQGVADYCKAHGGGKRCIEEGCNKSAQSATDYCIAHGGGKRCIEEGCNTSARGGYDYCVAHGGGKRCIEEGCNKSAQSATDYCFAHGGGKTCIEEGCTKSAQSATDYCVAHGGGKRCEGEACFIEDIPPHATFKENDKYYCNRCYYNIHPELISNGLYVRQEHLIIAEIHRIILSDLNVITIPIWDCPINNCTLKKPDLLCELDDIYILFEIDENGHIQTTERILSIRTALYNKPIILIRINPNCKNNPLLKQTRFSKWEATKNFDKCFIVIKNLILEELDKINNYDNNSELLHYTEICYNFNNINKLSDINRGDYIKTDYGYYLTI